MWVLGQEISYLELVTIMCSNLFDLDDELKSFFKDHPDLSFSNALAIILRHYLSPNLILQLNDFKNYFMTVNLEMYQEVFVDFLKKRRKTKY